MPMREVMLLLSYKVNTVMPLYICKYIFVFMNCH